MLKLLIGHKTNKLNSLLKYLVAAIILAVPLYPKFPLFPIPGTYVAVRLEDFLIFLVSVIWFIREIPNIPKLLKNNVVQAILIFLLVALVSVVSGIFLTETVVSHLGILHWLRRLEYLMGFFIGLTLLKSRENLGFYIKCLFIVVFILFIYGLGQKYLNWPIITTQNYEYSKGIALRFTPEAHIPSTFAGHYDLATFLILVSPLFFTIFFLVKDKISKFYVLFTILLGFWLLVNAVSRISIVSYLLSVSLVLILIRKYKAIPVVIFASVLFMSFSTNLVDRYTQVFQVTIKKVMEGRNKLNMLPYAPIAFAQEEVLKLPERRGGGDTPTPAATAVFEDRSTSIRFNVEWPRAIRAFLKNPILGTGFSSITLATDNHYLRLLGEVGVLGFMSFFLIFLRIGTIFYKTLPTFGTLNFRESFLAGIIASIPGIFLNAVFIDVFEASKFAIIFWLFVGLAVSVAKKVNNDDYS